jgi:hypothetical protein
VIATVQDPRGTDPKTRPIVILSSNEDIAAGKPVKGVDRDLYPFMLLDRKGLIRLQYAILTYGFNNKAHLNLLNSSIHLIILPAPVLVEAQQSTCSPECA